MASKNENDGHFDTSDHFIFDLLRFYLFDQYNDNISIYIFIQQVLSML